MDTEKRKFITGCILAPPIAPVILLLIIAIPEMDFRGLNYELLFNRFIEFIKISSVFIIFGAPIAYFVMIVFGLPIYFIAKRYNYINFLTVTVGSSIVAILPILIMSAKNKFILYDDPAKSSLLFYLTFALIGYVVGVVFWFTSGLSNQKYKCAQSNMINKTQ